MTTSQDLLNQICEACRADYDPAFRTTPRLSEFITGDLFVDDCCFIRDEIHFINAGRLIFRPKNRDGRKGPYCPSYFVVCRKLVIVGGSKPGSINPCGADDPGQEYKNNNVITWADRLNGAANGGSPSAPGPTPDGQDGATGALGKAGSPGANAPAQIVIVALEVVAGTGDHLSIDWNGQSGGKGGAGQNGADGGDGIDGNDGVVDAGWPSDSCDTEPQNGGNGGKAGNGGKGGPGGKGGDAGNIFVISTQANIGSGGAFLNGDLSYVNGGGFGGDGGRGGHPGQKGRPGRAGHVKGPCQNGADDGNPGLDGDPGDDGDVGGQGSGARTQFLPIISHTCSDDIPLPVTVTSVLPNLVARGHSTPDSADVAVIGANLLQVATITTSLAGVTATKKNSSTDSQLDLRIDMTGSSAIGAAAMTFAPTFGAALNVPGAITVERFEVLSVTPNAGSRNTTVSVGIVGHAFDGSAPVQSVNVSGPGVNVVNVAVIDSQHITCEFEIGGAVATLGPRNVTVNTGGNTHTLTGGFTVNA